MKKTFLTVVVLLLAWSNVDLKAQETITNAFDDLKRTGTVNEQDSEMRQATSDTALQKLLTQKPAAGYLNPAKRKATPIKNEKRFSEQKRKAMKIIKAILEIVSPLLLH